jgi:hypothetical protein
MPLGRELADRKAVDLDLDQLLLAIGQVLTICGGEFDGG